MRTEITPQVCNIINDLDRNSIKHKMIVDVDEYIEDIPFDSIKQIVNEKFNSKIDYVNSGKLHLYDKAFKKLERTLNTLDIQFISSPLIAEDICHAIADHLNEVLEIKPKKFYGPCINETEK